MIHEQPGSRTASGSTGSSFTSPTIWPRSRLGWLCDEPAGRRRPSRLLRQSGADDRPRSGGRRASASPRSTRGARRRCSGGWSRWRPPRRPSRGGRSGDWSAAAVTSRCCCARWRVTVGSRRAPEGEVGAGEEVDQIEGARATRLNQPDRARPRGDRSPDSSRHYGRTLSTLAARRRSRRTAASHRDCARDDSRRPGS